MNDQVRLGPAGQEDLAVIERLTGDPEATGEHSWHGWFEPRWFRRRWEETGLLTEDGGTLMVVRRGERLGFVSWRRQETARTSYCWNVGIAMLPEVRGMGTAPRRSGCWSTICSRTRRSTASRRSPR
jgi:hypothetical protein